MCEWSQGPIVFFNDRFYKVKCEHFLSINCKQTIVPSSEKSFEFINNQDISSDFNGIFSSSSSCLRTTRIYQRLIDPESRNAITEQVGRHLKLLWLIESRRVGNISSIVFSGALASNSRDGIYWMNDEFPPLV